MFLKLPKFLHYRPVRSTSLLGGQHFLFITVLLYNTSQIELHVCNVLQHGQKTYWLKDMDYLYHEDGGNRHLRNEDLSLQGLRCSYV